MERSNVDKWANFLMNEKLDASLLDERWVMELIRLAEACAKVRGPKIGMHKDKLLSRQFLCETAMNIGMDLTAIKKRNGKVAMGRGLLDAWMKVYQQRYGSAVGTTAEHEDKRRKVSTRLAERRKEEEKGKSST